MTGTINKFDDDRGLVADGFFFWAGGGFGWLVGLWLLRHATFRERKYDSVLFWYIWLSRLVEQSWWRIWCCVGGLFICIARFVSVYFAILREFSLRTTKFGAFGFTSIWVFESLILVKVQRIANRDMSDCLRTILIWIHAWDCIFFNLFIGILCWLFYGFGISNKMHCSYGTFATGGCDAIVNVWDGNNKKRLYQVNHMVI